MKPPPVSAGLGEALRALETAATIRRLLLLDSLWTGALAAEVDPGDAPVLTSVGEEMIRLLRHLQQEAGFVQWAIEHHPHAFEGAVNEALDAADSAAGHGATALIREVFGANGWATEVSAALQALRDSEPVEAELAGKVEAIRAGRTTPGDLPNWLWCASSLAEFGCAAASIVFFPPVGVAAMVLSAAEGALGLAGMVKTCRDWRSLIPRDQPPGRKFNL